MKQRKICLFLLLFASIGSFAQTKITSGLLLEGGLGSVNVDAKSAYKTTDYGMYTKYKFNVALGYRFRINPVRSPLFYDIDFNLGLKKWNYELLQYTTGQNNIPFIGITGENGTYDYTSIAGTANYKITKQLFAGIGVEPTYYILRSGNSGNSGSNFDMPLVAKLAYNFKFVEIAIAYKYGLTNIIKSDYLSHAKLNDIQLSLYVPF